jgi:photosynthetic reaction center cytochrome c subunit
MKFNLIFGGLVAAVAGLAFFVVTFERPRPDTLQGGFRGTSMGRVDNPRTQAALTVRNQMPPALEAADNDGPRASEVYENVQVLGHLSVEQFGRIMLAMSQWIYPNEENPAESCNGCHVPGNFAAEGMYQKTVARRMLQMVQTINTTYSSHVNAGAEPVGVTCYTCHRGNAIPAAVWATSPPNARLHRLLSTAPEQNRPVPANALSSLPTDPFTPYLLRDNPIGVQSAASRQADNNASILSTEWTYSLMMHMSSSLGVNCTFCHNSRNFSGWQDSTPQRVTAWHGIRMVRAINNDYIEPLRPEFPPHRLGPLGDTLKVNCTTCHQGVNLPLRGAQMLRDYPELNPPPRRASLEEPARN